MELLDSKGIIVPELTGISKILTPIAVVGFALIILGSFSIRSKNKYFKMLPLIVGVFTLPVITSFYIF